MRTLLLTLIFLILTPAANSQWQTLQTPASDAIIDISIPNPNIVWAAGESIVLNSSDGGQNWVVQNAPRSHCVHIYAVNYNTGWVTGNDSANTNNRVFKTTNAGANWVEQEYSRQSYINFIHFFNASTGIFIADPVDGIIGFFVTRNGGNSWERSPNSPLSDQLLIDNRMGVLDTNLVWFVSYTPNGYRLFKLSGGLYNAWQIYPFMNNSMATNVLFKDPNTALATDGFYVQISTNGGADWLIHNSSALGETLYQGSFINIPGTDWVLISGINERISYDFCVSWEPIIFLTGIYVRGLDTNNIYHTGLNGMLYKYDYNYIGIKKTGSQIPALFSLKQNYPNPFNPSTNIEFDVPSAAFVKLAVYDISGREIEILVNENLKPSRYSIKWDASSYPSGVYFHRIETDAYSQTRKMVLVK
jgi:photosystem II stability/assembly factor-like uncharacterized protein